MIDDAVLIAWLDGELEAGAAASVATAVAGDPALAEKAAAHRALADRLRHSFAPLLEEPLPQALATAVTKGTKIVDLASARLARSPGAPRRFAVPQWAAIAATLVIGVVAGQLTGRIGPPPLLAERGGALEARNSLATALDTQLASTPSSGAIHVALTFHGRGGRLCRTWSALAEAGIACRSGGAWRIVATAAAVPETGGYRTASVGDPRLMATVEAMITGEPLDAAQERRARAADWQ